MFPPTLKSASSGCAQNRCQLITIRSLLELEYGTLSTSGDSHRYLLKEGIRYGHILNALPGWPGPEAPRSITVAASSCTEVGLLLAKMGTCRRLCNILHKRDMAWLVCKARCLVRGSREDLKGFA